MCNFIYGPYSLKDFNIPIWPWKHSPGTTVVTVPEANVLANPILPPLCPPKRLPHVLRAPALSLYSFVPLSVFSHVPSAREN